MSVDPHPLTDKEIEEAVNKIDSDGYVMANVKEQKPDRLPVFLLIGLLFISILGYLVVKANRGDFSYTREDVDKAMKTEQVVVPENINVAEDYKGIVFNDAVAATVVIMYGEHDYGDMEQHYNQVKSIVRSVAAKISFEEAYTSNTFREQLARELGQIYSIMPLDIELIPSEEVRIKLNEIIRIRLETAKAEMEAEMMKAMAEAEAEVIRIKHENQLEIDRLQHERQMKLIEMEAAEREKQKALLK